MDLQQRQHLGGVPAGLPGGGMPVKTGNRSCLIFLVGIVLLVVGIVPFIGSVFPDLFKGQLVDAVYVPDDSGGGKLFYRTDNSFYYISRVETPGSLSISTQSLFNKTNDYFYDPVEKAVIRQTLKEYPSTPPHPRFFYVRKGVWVVTETLSGKFDADIQVIDPEAGNEIMNLQAFIDRFPELKSGIAELYVRDEAGEPVSFGIKTRDGQDLYYYLEADKIFPTITAYNKFAVENAPATVTVFALTFDGARGTLYKVTGPPSELLNTSFSSGNLKDPESVKFFYHAVAMPLTPGQVYLEGLMLYQDGELVVILHQDQIGKNVNRLLTVVDLQGKILWTLAQDQLFPELKLTKDDPFRETFFIKNELRGDREGDLFLFKFKEVGLMALDMKTGEKKWEFR